MFSSSIGSNDSIFFDDFFLCYVNQPLVFGTDPECILHAFQNNYHSLVFINRL